MQHVEVNAVIAAPIEKVWARYTDHVSWGKWAGVGPVRLEREGIPAPNGVGCIRVIGPGPFAVREEVVEFDAPRRMAYRLIGGLVPLRNHFGEVTFEPQGDSTRITWRCRFDASLPGMGGIAQRLVTRMFTKTLGNLARQKL